MIGKLYKENGKWFIKYNAVHCVDGGDTWEESMPVHPDDIEFHTYLLYEENIVEFEPVLIKSSDGGWKGKLNINFSPLNNTWDEIFSQCDQYESLGNFLKKNYHPPLKK